MFKKKDLIKIEDGWITDKLEIIYKSDIQKIVKERDKYKEVIDKIKEKLDILNEEPYNATTYIMVITEIYKLLEEIE